MDKLASSYSVQRKITFKNSLIGLVYVLLLCCMVVAFGLISYGNYKDRTIDSVSNHPELVLQYDNLRHEGLELLPFFDGNFLEHARPYENTLNVRRDENSGTMDTTAHVPLVCATMVQELGVCSSRYNCEADSDCAGTTGQPFLTGNCSRETRTCTQRYWCPEPPAPGIESQSELRLDISKGRLLLRSTATFPTLDVATSTEEIIALNGVNLTECSYSEAASPSCPNFRLQDMIGDLNSSVHISIRERYSCEQVSRAIPKSQLTPAHRTQLAWSDLLYPRDTIDVGSIDCVLNYEITKVAENRSSVVGFSSQLNQKTRLLYFCGRVLSVTFSSTGVLYRTGWTNILWDIIKSGATIYGLCGLIMLCLRFCLRGCTASKDAATTGKSSLSFSGRAWVYLGATLVWLTIFGLATLLSVLLSPKELTIPQNVTRTFLAFLSFFTSVFFGKILLSCLTATFPSLSFLKPSPEYRDRSHILLVVLLGMFITTGIALTFVALPSPLNKFARQQDAAKAAFFLVLLVCCVLFGTVLMTSVLRCCSAKYGKRWPANSLRTFTQETLTLRCSPAERADDALVLRTAIDAELNFDDVEAAPPQLDGAATILQDRRGVTRDDMRDLIDSLADIKRQQRKLKARIRLLEQPETDVLRQSRSTVADIQTKADRSLRPTVLLSQPPEQLVPSRVNNWVTDVAGRGIVDTATPEDNRSLSCGYDDGASTIDNKHTIGPLRTPSLL